MNKTKQPRKQRKRLYNLPLHQKRKLLNVTLTKELRARFKRRSLQVRKGDRVRVITGSAKGTEGEVMNVDVSETKVYIDRILNKKRDGTEVLKAMPPSNLMLIDIDLRDKMRQAILERKVSKAVIEEEVKKEEERLKKEEAARKAKEAEAKRKEEEAKAEKKEKAEAKTTAKGKKKPKTKVSEQGITDKTKKDWIAGK